jgi:hypothetical protein
MFVLFLVFARFFSDYCLDYVVFIFELCLDKFRIIVGTILGHPGVTFPTFSDIFQISHNVPILFDLLKTYDLFREFQFFLILMWLSGRTRVVEGPGVI